MVNERDQSRKDNPFRYGFASEIYFRRPRKSRNGYLCANANHQNKYLSSENINLKNICTYITEKYVQKHIVNGTVYLDPGEHYSEMKVAVIRN